MTNNNTPFFAVGDSVVIQNRGGGWDGVTGTIESVNPDPVHKDDGALYRVKYDDPAQTPFEDVESGPWTHNGGFLAKMAEHQGSGPRAILQHDTSKEYAARATSRSLPDWANMALIDAAAGQEVDVVEFRKAATKALSLAVTRTSNSSDRSAFAREARHLIYWADAIIDNHIKGLPVYEGGPRSPKIQELKLEKGRLMFQVERLEQERAALKQAASEERRRLVAEINELQESRRKAIANARDAAANELSEVKDELADVRRVALDFSRQLGDERDRVRALIREKTDLEVRLEDQQKRAYEETRHLYTEINETHAALEYAFGLLASEDAARVAGFRDGYATRVIED